MSWTLPQGPRPIAHFLVKPLAKRVGVGGGGEWRGYAFRTAESNLLEPGGAVGQAGRMGQEFQREGAG